MNKSDTRREGLLGGSFDPVHFGHLGLAAEIRERFHLDRILFIPAHVSPHKQGQPVTPSFHRREMLRLAIEDKPSFELSEIELQRKGVSYTIDTLNALQAGNPATEFYLIMAADTFQDLGTWKEYRRVLEDCNVLVAERPGFTMGNPDEALQRLYQELMPYQVESSGTDAAEYRRRDNGRTLVFFQLKTPTDISSHEIRHHVHQKTSIKNLLPPQVEHYIIENNLY